MIGDFLQIIEYHQTVPLICGDCERTLDVADKFRRQCVQADMHFRSVANVPSTSESNTADDSFSVNFVSVKAEPLSMPDVDSQDFYVKALESAIDSQAGKITEAKSCKKGTKKIKAKKKK